MIAKAVLDPTVLRTLKRNVREAVRNANVGLPGDELQTLQSLDFRIIAKFQRRLWRRLSRVYFQKGETSAPHLSNISSNESPLLCKYVDEVTPVKSREPLGFSEMVTSTLGLKITLPPPNRTVMVFTRRLDLDADLVELNLFARGYDCVRVDREDIPTAITLDISARNKKTPELTLGVRGRQIKKGQVGAIWVHHFDLDEWFGGRRLMDVFALKQWSGMLRMLMSELGCEWINNPIATMEASNKLRQLLLARKLGFAIPPTHFTNNPKTVANLYGRKKGLIMKTISEHAFEIDSQLYSIYSHKVADSDRKLVKPISSAPFVLQDIIERISEVRVTVIGNQAYAIRMDLGKNKRGKIDIHRAPISVLPKTSFTLDPAFRRKCLLMIRELGLRYGNIDFVVRNNGDYVFLETNPTADWYWIERQTSIPITASMTSMLCEIADKYPSVPGI